MASWWTDRLILMWILSLDQWCRCGRCYNKSNLDGCSKKMQTTQQQQQKKQSSPLIAVKCHSVETYSSKAFRSSNMNWLVFQAFPFIAFSSLATCLEWMQHCCSATPLAPCEITKLSLTFPQSKGPTAEALSMSQCGTHVHSCQILHPRHRLTG